MSELVIRQIEFILQETPSVLKQIIHQSNLSDTAILDALNKGAIWQQKSQHKKIMRIRTIDETLKTGDKLFLNYNSAVLATTPLEPKLLSDQGNYSIWFKPKGMLSQGSKWSNHCTITEVISKKQNKASYLVHRLDKASSGIMLIAHTKNATKQLARLFAQRKIDKYYRATVAGQCQLSFPYTINYALDEKPAITIIEKAEYDSRTNQSALSLRIETGRKHQIRRHLSMLEMPIIGDRLYNKRCSHQQDLALEAYKIRFTCPFSNTELEFKLE